MAKRTSSRKPRAKAAADETAAGAAPTEAPAIDEEGDTDDFEPPFIAAPPIHPEQEAVWRQRAAEYASAYKGPDHWRCAINVIAATGSLPLALREANVTRHSFNRRRERYPEFATAVTEATEFFREKTIEQTAVMRAVDGWLEPVFHKGMLVGYKRRFSDTIMVKLMEGLIPEKYRPKQDVAFSGTVKVEGGLPQMPLTEDDVPEHVRKRLTLEHDPHALEAPKTDETE